MREFSATNVPYPTEQSFPFRCGTAFVPSSFGNLWMAHRSPSSFASSLQLQIPLHEGFQEEFRNRRSSARTTPAPGSATEPGELESFQPSMLCNRSLPIYFLTTDRFPQLHSDRCED